MPGFALMLMLMLMLIANYFRGEEQNAFRNQEDSQWVIRWQQCVHRWERQLLWRLKKVYLLSWAVIEPVRLNLRSYRGSQQIIKSYR